MKFWEVNWFWFRSADKINHTPRNTTTFKVSAINELLVFARLSLLDSYCVKGGAITFAWDYERFQESSINKDQTSCSSTKNSHQA